MIATSLLASPNPATYHRLEREVSEWLRVLADLMVQNGETERAARLLRARDSLGLDWAALRAKDARRSSRAGRAEAGPLSCREGQVAERVARGLTNRQIADELIISERTADTHVQNILAKLGCNSRAQIASWVVTRMRDSSD